MLPAIRNPAPAEPMPPDSFPRWVLLCGAGVIAFSLLSVALVRITGNGPDQKPAPSSLERPLRFEDRPDGGVASSGSRSRWLRGCASCRGA